MSDWWEVVANELERLDDSAPDPWGHLAQGSADDSLTPEQRAFLMQLVDTPSNELDADDFSDDP